VARGRKLENLGDFKRALKSQYGFGTGKDYKPWLRVQDVKSRGQGLKVRGIKTGRLHQFHSIIEMQAEAVNHSV